MDPSSKIFVAGARGLVGSAVCRRLQAAGFAHILTPPSAELDLTNQARTQAWFAEHRPDYVIDAAAHVGGIHANATYPADFLYTNLMIQNNLVHSAYESGVKKLLFLGSSCVYPKFAPQPIQEASLLSSALEPTNEAYAVAKIAGIKLCDAFAKQHGANFLSAMPCNIYGQGDNFHAENSHVIPALMRRFHEAAKAGDDHVECWGTGTPLREFLYSDDLADGILFLLLNVDGPGLYNVGAGEDISIGDLATLISEVVGFKGRIVWNPEKPDGTPKKLMDVTKMRDLGWRHQTSITEGLRLTYEWFREHQADYRR